MQRRRLALNLQMLWSGCSSHAANESKWAVAVTIEQEWTENRIFQMRMHIYIEMQTLKMQCSLQGYDVFCTSYTLMSDFDKSNAGKNIPVMQY